MGSLTETEQSFIHLRNEEKVEIREKTRLHSAGFSKSISTY